MAADVATAGGRASGSRRRSSAAATSPTSWPASPSASTPACRSTRWPRAPRRSTPPAHRGEVRALASGVTVIDDAYNANPLAVERALDVLGAETGAPRRVAVLGEMLELGPESAALHARVRPRRGQRRRRRCWSRSAATRRGRSGAARSRRRPRRRRRPPRRDQRRGRGAGRGARARRRPRAGQGLARRAPRARRRAAWREGRADALPPVPLAARHTPWLRRAERDPLHHVPHRRGEHHRDADQPGRRARS